MYLYILSLVCIKSKNTVSVKKKIVVGKLGHSGRIVMRILERPDLTLQGGILPSGNFIRGKRPKDSEPQK